MDSFGPKQPFNDEYLQALREIGIPTIADVNADMVFGATDNQGNIWNGRRQSVAKAFLIPAKHRKNLDIFYYAEVKKNLTDQNNRAYGVKFAYKRKHKMKAFVRKEVILSAGSIMSPKVLMLSGIGPKLHLKQHNIPLKSDLAVGSNYIDHLILRLFVSFMPSTMIPPKTTTDLDDFYDYLIHSGGPLATKPLSAQLTGFINSQNQINTNYTDIQLHFYYNPRNSDFRSSGYTEYNDQMREYLTEKPKR